MIPVSSIEAWLSTIAPPHDRLLDRKRAAETEDIAPSKRARSQSSKAHCLNTTPDPVERMDSAFGSNKEGEDIDRTPTQTDRARRRRGRSKHSTPRSSRTKKSRSTASSSSYADSVSQTAKLGQLQDLPEPIKVDVLQLDKIPNEHGVRTVLEEMEFFVDGAELGGISLLDELGNGCAGAALRIRPIMVSNVGSRRTQLGSDPTSREISQIVQHAIDCSKMEAPETTWNTQVHAMCLNLAVGLSVHSNTMTADNVTHAKINPRFKIRSSEYPDLALSKLVDFVLVMKESRITDANRDKLLQEHNWTRDYNHTFYGMISSRPICVSIETKVEGEGQRAGRKQLMIWTAMHFKRLESILAAIPKEISKSTGLPCLPVLFIQGPRWYCSVARRDGSCTTLYEDLYIGDVRRPDGVLKVIAAILLLLEWSQKSYRPWFEAVMTQATAEQEPRLFPDPVHQIHVGGENAAMVRDGM
ncbi:Hypothetical protein D9617_64g101380 [Elsinoe fawcettii]|nr:Hypothetical protein D9617_64g101380 [Elsinoe fawcettii]